MSLPADLSTLTDDQALTEARRAFGRGDHERARVLFAGLVKRHPHLRGALGASQLAAGRPAEALATFRRVLADRPGDGLAHLHAAFAAQHLGDEPTAIAHLEQAERGLPDQPDRWAQLAERWADRRAFEHAARAAHRALELDPRHGHARLVAAIAARCLGRPDEAIEHCTSGLAAHPSLEHATRLTGELGNALDALDEVAAAYEAYCTRGAMCLQLAHRRSIPLDAYPNEVGRTVRWLASRPPFPRPAPAARSPAFFVAFPRSGTTLMQQMLRQHPSVSVVEERPALAEVARELSAGASCWPSGLGALSGEKLVAARERYWSRLDPDGRARQRAIVVDKMPLNLPLLPVALSLFPGARVLLALRDPRDVVLSGLVQDWKLNAAMVQLVEPQRSAALYDQVMQLWRHLAHRDDVDACTWRYEDLVDRPRMVVGRVLDHLGLPFDPAVLEHHRRAGTELLSTPSRHAVTRRLNRRAVGRWTRYRLAMAPIMPILAPWVHAFGYPANDAA